ncbi:DUF4407 domain-containing protein [Microtetraspora sp. AC03309]|uniref:DUF4407 domain-containing protein n=1 Tax=Microtetraspora sp. AC03309 TaxID=2779376 RepID=UPI001E49FC58|nr:DUF4407 domain-containing protein [Microtetraspora sp. AC03309]MCC5574609.1 DUF4407 domain-containing protein [Microtetraspora sp. AC03309]
MSRFLGTLSAVLIALSGARPEVLRTCPSERGKFEGIGGAVLTTSVLAVVSMTFALNSALGVNIVLAVATALLWGLAILSLDRWLVSTIRADAPNRWALAAPRIVIAVVLGLVISTPLVLQVFKAEIDTQIVEMKQRRADAFAVQQEQGAVGKGVDQLRKEVAGLRQVISSGGDVPLDIEQDTKIKALSAQRADEQKQADKHYKEWQCQLYGGANCPKKGNGPLAQESERAYEKDKKRIELLARQIETRKGELNATGEQAKETRLAAAKEALPKAQSQLDIALAQQARIQRSFDEDNLATDGLLTRLRALNELTGKDLTLSMARLLLFALFLLIECLPVAVKLMQRPGVYEKALALAQRQELDGVREAFGVRAAPRRGSADPGGSGSVWRIWSPQEDEPRRRTASFEEEGTRSPQGSAEGPNGTRVESADPGHEYGSLEDEALRGMADTRILRRPGPGAERSGGIELLPDED